MDSLAALLLFVAVAIVIGALDWSLRRHLGGRLNRIEEKLDRLAEHAGLQPPSDPRLAEVVRLARSGDKIKAIKLYRDLTGADLVEAKHAVDQLA